jgi:DNA-directed RNA polymerase subunit RPC12/RpoP
MENFVCKICGREFKNISSLASHLSNKRNNCNISIKEYYDKFLRKEGEGICQFCGSETSFGGLNQGYPFNICKHCRNKNPLSKEIRNQNFYKKREEKKIKKDYYNFPFVCELCKISGKEIRFKSMNGLGRHIGSIHKNEMTVKDYYDKYFKKEDEGIRIKTLLKFN